VSAPPDDLLPSPGACEQLVDHLVGKAVADRFSPSSIVVGRSGSTLPPLRGGISQ
jgi:hypothetical protein